jgi:transcription-repair coupling factor (superfamily II helicase)
MHLTAQDSLGAGFAVSAHDLDMRGAGDLVSDEQSGHMKLVGIELYQHLLSNVLRELAGERAPPPLPPIEGGSSGYFPADWIVEPDARVAAYIRLARASASDEFDLIRDELEDRYGALPDAAAKLLDDRRMSLGARALGIERVQIGPAGIALTPSKGVTPPEGAPVEVKDERWLFKFEAISDPEARHKAAAELFEALS